MPLILRRFVIRPAFVVAAMAMAAPFGCEDRTGMLAGPGDEAPVAGPGAGASGGASGQPSSSGGAGGVANSTGGAGGYRVAAGGYVTSGPWSGYAWTTTDSPDTSLSPSDFSGVGDGGRLCVKGQVSDHGLEVFAILGINVAQPQSGGSVGVWTPTGSGLTYRLTVNLDSPLRITIQGAAGYPDESWCANITASAGQIAWMQFKQSCWASYGSYYDGKTPLESVMFEVPGISATRVNYDFCLDGVGPI